MKERRAIRRRALRIVQIPEHPVYLFALRPQELFAVADISRVSRNDIGDLIGYQRPEVKRHVKNIVEYLQSGTGHVLFPNTIILALSSTARFVRVRGPRVDKDEIGDAGTLDLPVPRPGQLKPAWIVDGQQRALALSHAKWKDIPIPISAFVADNIDVQREQFLRVNSTKPLPRGLLSELLPQVSTVLPAALAARRVPAALCELLNRDPESPFRNLIKRSSYVGPDKRSAVVSDTSLIQLLQESYTSPSGCLFAYRNLATGDTDFERVRRLLIAYWSAVRDTFPNAWGLSPQASRLMHSVGLRAMGRLMDRVMGSLDVDDPKLGDRVRRELAPLKGRCHWTSGVWSEVGSLRWNELQNLPGHLRLLSNYVLRVALRSGAAS
jgi:DGQHR domain-containing protein